MTADERTQVANLVEEAYREGLEYADGVGTLSTATRMWLHSTSQYKLARLVAQPLEMCGSCPDCRWRVPGDIRRDLAKGRSPEDDACALTEREGNINYTDCQAFGWGCRGWELE